eukprot:COSAG01_NODE_6577_length_3598_cov_9.061732_3_plen_97_part_00
MKVRRQLQRGGFVELVGLSSHDHRFIGLVVAGDAAPRPAPLLLGELAPEKLRGVISGPTDSALGGWDVCDAVVDLIVVCGTRQTTQTPAIDCATLV